MTPCPKHLQPGPSEATGTLTSISSLGSCPYCELDDARELIAAFLNGTDPWVRVKAKRYLEGNKTP